MTPFTSEGVEDLLHAHRDNAEKSSCGSSFELMTGARVTNVRRLNRGMIKATPMAAC